MALPGTANQTDPELLDRADEEAESLLEELKQQAKAEIRDVGTLRKEIAVTVPGTVITGRLDKNFGELRNDMVMPGFRKGRAPMHLIQKRFGSEVRDTLKTTVIGQSFFAVAANNKLEVLGDPLFRVETPEGVKLTELGEAAKHIKLPAEGDLTYVCEVEVKPTFELPELKGIDVKSPKVEITDEMVNSSIERQQRIRGKYEPVDDGAQAGDDLISAHVAIKADGKLVKEEDNVQLGVRPTRLDGIPLSELDKTLTGAKVGDKKSAESAFPEDYERTDLRGKPCVFEFEIREVKRLVPASIDELVQAGGFSNADELRAHFRSGLEDERDRLIEQAMREQVLQYLLDNTKLDTPSNLSARQTDRAVMRKVVELQQNGVPQSDIEAQIDALRTSAAPEVARNLKLEFILEKVAKGLGVSVTEEELNTEIARIARSYGMRFDRVRDNLRSGGLLPQLVEQIRQDKCVRALLSDAKIVETSGKAD